MLAIMMARFVASASTSSGRQSSWPSGPVMPRSSIRFCSWVHKRGVKAWDETLQRASYGALCAQTGSCSASTVFCSSFVATASFDTVTHNLSGLARTSSERKQCTDCQHPTEPFKNWMSAQAKNRDKMLQIRIFHVRDRWRRRFRHAS